MREALGPPDALERCARYAVALAHGERGMIRIYHTSDLHDQRGIVAPLRALRERAAGIALRLRRLAARQPNRVPSQRADRRRDRRAPATMRKRSETASFTISFGLLRARARECATRSSARTCSIPKDARCPFCRSLAFEAADENGRRYACTSSGS